MMNLFNISTLISPRMEQFSKLNLRLFDEGLISEEEYKALKKKALNL